MRANRDSGTDKRSAHISFNAQSSLEVIVILPYALHTMTDITQAAANDKVAEPPKAPEDVEMPMGKMVDDSKDVNRAILITGLILSAFFGLFGLIGLLFITEKRRRRSYLKGCIIGIIIALIILAVLVIVLPLTT